MILPPPPPQAPGEAWKEADMSPKRRNLIVGIVLLAFLVGGLYVMKVSNMVSTPSPTPEGTAYMPASQELIDEAADMIFNTAITSGPVAAQAEFESFTSLFPNCRFLVAAGSKDTARATKVALHLRLAQMPPPPYGEPVVGTEVRKANGRWTYFILAASCDETYRD